METGHNSVGKIRERGRGRGRIGQDKDWGEEWRQDITAWVRFGRGEGGEVE